MAKLPDSVLHRVASTLAMSKASARSIVQRARSAVLAFSLDTFSDKTFRLTTGGSFVLLVLPHWLICTAVALSIAVAAEIRKEILRRTVTKAIGPVGASGRKLP